MNTVPPQVTFYLFIFVFSLLDELCFTPCFMQWVIRVYYESMKCDV